MLIELLRPVEVGEVQLGDLKKFQLQRVRVLWEIYL